MMFRKWSEKHGSESLPLTNKLVFQCNADQPTIKPIVSCCKAYHIYMLTNAQFHMYICL